MAYQFNGFRASKPVVRLIGLDTYEVFFIGYQDALRKVFRYKKGINSLIKSERKKEAASTAEVLWEALNNKWNPFLNKYPKFDYENKKNVLLGDGLDKAIEFKRKILSKYSMYDYEACVRFLKLAAKKSGFSHYKCSEFKKADIKVLISEAKEINEWSSKARNKYLSIFRSLMTVLEDEEIIDFNPASKIKNEPEEETMGFRRLTDEEKEKIADHLLLNAPDFFDYLMFIYDDGIRRKETLLLEIRDFNLTRREILIRPEVAKTNKARIVPITDTILQVLLSRKIWEYPSNYFLFSNNKFKPGAIQYHPNTPTRWWMDLVIEGLGIDCKMYSLKHKGADDKIKSGIDLDVLKTLYGHKSKQMTEIYAREVKEKYKEKIIDNAPAFAKVVQMKRAK